jgi:ornithine decarboxylase
MPFVEKRFLFNTVEEVVEATSLVRGTAAITAANTVAANGKQSIYSNDVDASRLMMTPLGNGASNSRVTDSATSMGMSATSLAFKSVDDALRHQLNTIKLTGAEENAFFIADLGHLHKQYQRWRMELPRVHPYYAVKCNPSQPVVNTLAAMGVNFDCASKAEIQSVLEAGICPSRIIYANPCKQMSHIRYAISNGVRTMTFDNVDELHKVCRVSRDVSMVIRILVDDSKSQCQLGIKFGAPMETIESLLAAARDLNVHLAGVSFHVGSGCYDAEAFRSAVLRAKHVFALAPKYGHHQMNTLDVGGGFPGSEQASVKFDMIAKILRSALDEHFPPESGVKLIAEPGRYFIQNAFTLAVNVIARRVVYGQNNEANASDSHNNELPSTPSYMYYINDGLYGSFNCVMFDHAIIGTPGILMHNGQFYGRDHPHQRLDYKLACQIDVSYDTSAGDPENASISIAAPDETITASKALLAASSIPPAYNCSIWGPTCDSLDCIQKDCLLPELRVGDWLRYDGMGAYTTCAASRFNGFRQTPAIYIDTTGALVSLTTKNDACN